MGNNLDNLLTEKRKFKPSKEFIKQANIKDPKIWKKAAKNPDKFWASWGDQLDWFKPYKKVRKGKMGDATWFLGGKLNACYNAVDRHLLGKRRYKTAILWQGEDYTHSSI